ncbi:MAG: hypothetical protein JWL61_3779 [Gemmatimonadetes bacterium]|jgi:glycosyltransferase involved in cell wall biosynthesis|nr:hypothetical protein [Gemmatimonadota bacterium]
MNILHVSNTDLAGGRFTGLYMQRALGVSHRVDMAVWNRTSESASVHQLPPRNRLLHGLADAVGSVADRAGFDGLLGTSGWMLPATDCFKKADVVHLHLIHGGANFSILSLPSLSRRKPLVWTLHDPWASTGGCEHSFECVKWMTGCAAPCPHPRRTALFMRSSTHPHWEVKRRVYERADVTLVVASQWMEQRIANSPLLRHLPCHRIPFGIDLSVFKPMNKAEARRILGIPTGHKVIAFRDVGLASDRFKGMRWLRDALQLYTPDTPTTLLILEDGKGFAELSTKYDVRPMGWVDGEELARVLGAADAFVMPSIQESFGLMAVEAMACGTPVVVADGTALPQVIDAPVGGVVVPPMDREALIGALKQLLDNDELRAKIGVQARQLAEREYSLDLYGQRHLRLYAEVIERHAERTRRTAASMKPSLGT